MYEQLMEKNINNHKVISKYLFYHSGKVFRKVRSHKHIKIVRKDNIQ